MKRMRTEQELDLIDFAGRNADKMLQKMGPSLLPQLNSEPQSFIISLSIYMVWPAFFVTFVWMFYRKMYLEGAAFIVLPIVLSLLLPSLEYSSGIFTLTPWILAGLLGGTLYLSHAKRRIAKADAQGLKGPARSTYLTRAGGVSVAGAILGVIIDIAVTGLVFLPELQNLS